MSREDPSTEHPCPTCSGTERVRWGDEPHETCICPACDGSGVLECADCGDVVTGDHERRPIKIDTELDEGTVVVDAVSAACARCVAAIDEWRASLRGDTGGRQ